MLQVTFPDEVEEWVQSQAASNGQNVDDYLLSVVKRIQADQDEAKRDHLEKLLLEALESGDPIRPDDKWWADLEAECMAKIDAQGQNGHK